MSRLLNENNCRYLAEQAVAGVFEELLGAGELELQPVVEELEEQCCSSFLGGCSHLKC